VGVVVVVVVLVKPTQDNSNVLTVYRLASDN